MSDTLNNTFPAEKDVESTSFSAVVSSAAADAAGATDAPGATDVPGATGATIARLERVTLAYERTGVALDDVSLELAAGERVCVLGANGSGKTTLALVLCGLLAPDAGSVELLGHACCVDGAPDMDAYRRARRELGLVFQDPQDQIVTSVVDEDVAFGPENLGLDAGEIGSRVARELGRVAMGDFAHADPSRLSGGQRQRVAIAGALAMDPRLLVLDEPGALLDVRGRRSIMRVMGRLAAAGTTVVHVTHFMQEALSANRVIVMDAGHVAFDGRPDEAFSHVEAMRGLGLEEPFCGSLAASLRARGVDVPWTCRADELVASLAALPHAPVGAPATGATATGAANDPAPTPTEKDAEVATPAIVSCDNVGLWYGRRNGDAALEGVSLELAPGTFCSVVGQTGSGKSSLLRLLAALDAPDEGVVRMCGVATGRRRDRRRLHGRVGLVMQRPERQLFAETVLDDVAYGPSNQGLPRNEAQARAREALAIVGLVGREDASPFSLSGGQRRLCAIAGILAMRPEILLLDEPMAGLDPRGRNRLREVLATVRATETTVVQVTHSMDEAARSDVVAVLDRGHLAAFDSPAVVFTHDNEARLREAGLGLPHPLEFAHALGREGFELGCEPLCATQLADAIARATSPTHFSAGNAAGDGEVR